MARRLFVREKKQNLVLLQNKRLPIFVKFKNSAQACELLSSWLYAGFED
jgi:hypothetical protein